MDNSIMCPMHGPSSCVITNIYHPFDGETGEVILDYYSLMGHWKCKKCDRTGLELLKKIYDTTNINK